MYKNLGSLIIVCGLLLSLAACNNSTETKTEETFKPGITLANYAKLKEGMSYQEVINVLGSKGKLISEIGTKNSNGSYQAYYVWDKENKYRVTVKFANDKLRTTEQIGLD
ncbi:hypothetical protein JOC77_004339 [Peribacillus deserti]|uniref:DUF3862 domain-containing protein n=1 Tax=Peribacillus deserti TaxID=673318 RepID=A0ABS2QP98_9BACI|nr:hypothetical protein [Peribacillus deserti]MBM7694860.1 hypothetical protein [Peribacillus deserti]